MKIMAERLVGIKEHKKGCRVFVLGVSFCIKGGAIGVCVCGGGEIQI